jgi:hypothetical protein
MKTPRENKIDWIRRAAASLSPLDYAATLALVAIYAIGTSLDEGPKTDMAFYSASATVIPGLLIAVAIQGRVLELSQKISFRVRYRTVLLAIVVFGGETGALMTLGRQETNWAAHLFVYLALASLGVTLLYLALAGPGRFQGGQGEEDQN